MTIAAAARARRLRPPNRVLPVLVGAAATAVAAGGFLDLAPNRLVSGHAIGLFAASDPRSAAAIVGLGLALLAAAALPARAGFSRAGALLAAAFVVVVLAAAGEAAMRIAAAAPSPARVSLGTAFWVLIGAGGLAVVDGMQRARAGPAERLAIVAALLAAVVLIAESGGFDALSLAHEYRAHRQQFAAALLRHLVLVAGAVAPALAIGLPLGVVAAHRPRWQGPVFATLNLLQTIPSIALFGLLLAPLSALAAAFPALAAAGIGGIGMAPALIALVLYALLPVARNAASGMAGVDRAAVEAARGMGMSRRQVLWRIELPLAAPLLLAGLRIVVVQTIGLAVVAALIGAGGLGDFVFGGLGQYATGLVLLGALPAIGLALAADFLLQLAASLAVRRLLR